MRDARRHATPEPPPRAPAPRPPQRPIVTVVVLAALLAWNVFLFWPRPASDIRIPYTAFLEQVRAGNIRRVTVARDRIAGTFAAAVRWPPEGARAKEADERARDEAPRSSTTFRTVLPQAVGDRRLLPLLERHHVVVDAEETTTPWLVGLLISWGPLLLLFAFFSWMGRQATRQQAGLFGLGRSRARRYASDRPEVTFGDVAGADEAKADLEEEVDFLRNPTKYHRLGARIPRGVLLVGPPGSGKTLLARAVAGEARVPFFNLNGSEFVEMFVGVGASRVRDLFAQVKAAAPAIVFIDELDAVGRRRGAGLGPVNDEREQTLNQLLVEMDGFDERHEVIVLAATNRPDVLDPAILRPGRFDRRIEVSLPDRRGREGILRLHTRRLPVGPDVDLDVLAQATMGLSGADLANLCNEAILVAARDDREHVTMRDFGEAQDKVVLGGVRRLRLVPRDRRVIAYHEAGHALVAWRTPAADPVRKVTIVPHGRALGSTEQLPGDDRYNVSRTELLARLTVMLGGRTAEELALGDVTTGAENDLVEATALARRMITRWGMGRFGLAAFRADEQQPFLGYDLTQGRDYSDATAARVDEEIERLLAEHHEIARRLLAGARAQLDRLVETLVRDDTIDHEGLVRILGARPDAGVPAAVTERRAG